jgi:hypothetical protein
MNITEMKPKIVGSKKAIEPAVLNGEILPSTTKRSNFDLVAAGVCPHDNARLGDEIRGSGVGVTRVCESCGHKWYLNRKIRTCKCLTCSGASRNTTERKIANRIENQSLQKAGGPLWTRTRDPSLIRTVL